MRRLRIEQLEQRSMLSIAGMTLTDAAAEIGSVDPGVRPNIISEQEWARAVALPEVGTVMVHPAGWVQEMRVKLADLKNALLGWYGSITEAYAWQKLWPVPSRG